MVWKPISTAPYVGDLEIAVIETDGAPHAVSFPCHRVVGGWVAAESREWIKVRPTHWRVWPSTNASKHKAMSYERMKKREAELKAEVACMLAAAEAADVQEDEIFGKDKRGDEMPDWASDKAKRLAKIQEAMAALEADAKLAAEEERRIEAEKQQQRNAEGRKKPGKPAAPLPDQPDPKAQRNFTDPDSRIMKSKEGFVQAYNAQAAVDAHCRARTHAVRQ